MSSPVIRSVSETTAILREALNRRTPLVLSYRHEGRWHTLKSRVLDLDVDARRLTIELPPDANGKPINHLQQD